MDQYNDTPAADTPPEQPPVPQDTGETRPVYEPQVYEAPPSSYPPPPVPPPAPPARNTRRTWLIVLIVVVVLCCCCLLAAYLSYQYLGDWALCNFVDPAYCSPLQ